jgi:trk system potassium uptake protein TrkA
MGCGRVGAGLAQVLDAEGHKVTIIDVDSKRFDGLPSDFSGMAFLGNATDEEVLRKAGMEQADAFVALTRDDERNAMAAQIAKEIFNVPKVLCRIYDPLREEFYRGLGLEALSPTRVFVRLLQEKLEG